MIKRASLYLSDIQKEHLLESKEQYHCILLMYTMDSLKAAEFTSEVELLKSMCSSMHKITSSYLQIQVGPFSLPNQTVKLVHFQQFDDITEMSL